MIVMLKDDPLVIGIGRDLNEAVSRACNTNRRVGSEPTDVTEMKALIDAGAIKVREYAEKSDAVSEARP